MSTHEKKWVDCQFIQFTQKNACVVRIVSTGAIVLVNLREPLDLSRACMITALNPAKARIQLGEYKSGGFHDCELDILWPAKRQIYPPPKRFVKKQRIPVSTSGEA